MSQPVTKQQVSAGGVVFRLRGGQTEVALISVGETARWQLPKGLVAPEEHPEDAALREVREETGLTTQLIAPLDVIEYWYLSGSGATRTRFHKYVHFYLFRHLSGDVRDHDHEVNEARWVEINEARKMLAFKNEKKVMESALSLISKDL